MSKRVENAPLTTLFNHLRGGVHDPPSPRPNILRLKTHCSHPLPAVGRLLAFSHTARSHLPTLPPPRLSQVTLFDQNCCPWAKYVALAVWSSCGTWCCLRTTALDNQQWLPSVSWLRDLRYGQDVSARPLSVERIVHRIWKSRMGISLGRRAL